MLINLTVLKLSNKYWNMLQFVNLSSSHCPYKHHDPLVVGFCWICVLAMLAFGQCKRHVIMTSQMFHSCPSGPNVHASCEHTNSILGLVFVCFCSVMLGAWTHSTIDVDTDFQLRSKLICYKGRGNQLHKPTRKPLDSCFDSETFISPHIHKRERVSY